MTRRNFGRLSTAVLGAGLASAQKLDYPWRRGVITDEVSFELPPVLEKFCPRYGLKLVEIRDVTIDGKKMYVSTEATEAQAREIRKQVEGAGIKVSVLDTPVYKIPLPGTTPDKLDENDLHPVQGAYEKQLEQLRYAAAIAHAMGTQNVRIFSYRRVADPNAVMSRVIDDLNKAITVAKAEGITLLLENEFSCNVASGEEINQVCKAITDRTLMLVWDSGNTAMLGEEAFPKAWDQFDHSRIGHLHLKDCKNKKWMPIGSGDIDFVAQFKALKAMRYKGTMSLETHYRNAAKDLYTSSVESMDGLMKVLEQV